MKKECCDVKVIEIENGYRIEIKGDDVKDKCKSVIEKCCNEEAAEKRFEACCKEC